MKMSLLGDIENRDIIISIISYSSTPWDYLSQLLVCRLWNSIGKQIIRTIFSRFIQLVKTNEFNKPGEYAMREEYWAILPRMIKHGEYKQFKPDGNSDLYRKIDYYCGKKHGMQTEYYMNENTVHLEISFVKDQFDGAYKTYHSDGRIFEDLMYKNGERNGKSLTYQNYKVYGDDKYRLTGEYNYKNGVVDGEQKTFECGVMTSHYHSRNGKLDGEYKQWYADGKLKYIGTYVNGLETGCHKEYDQSSNLISECNYIRGLRNGRFIDWRKDLV